WSARSPTAGRCSRPWRARGQPEESDARHTARYSNWKRFVSLLTRQVAKKVPELTVYFWIIKVLTTGMGEATSDYFVHTYDPYLVVILAGLVLAISVIVQVALTHYEAWSYWFAVSMVAVFGTMAAGIVHIYFGVPYIYSSSLYAASVIVIFMLW